MKIAVIADYFLADMGYPKVSLIKTWQKQNHLVKVICGNRYFPFHNYSQTVRHLIGPRHRLAGIHQEKGIAVNRQPVIFELFARALFSGIGPWLDKFDPEVVVVFGITSCSAIQTAITKKFWHHQYRLIMVDSHLPSELSLGNQTVKGGFYWLFRCCFSKLITRQTDVFIATQDQTVDVIRDVYGITSPIQLIPNGTDTTLFKKSLVARKKIRRQLAINNQNLVIIYTGKVIPEKGVDILFKAFNVVATKYENIQLLIVGDGSPQYKSKCMSLVNHSLKKKIHWVGYQPQTRLVDYYSAADMAIWPLQESLAMNDAASCQLPFIANHTMGDKTRISNDNALLYKRGDTTDLTKKITNLYRDKKLRLVMGKKGRQLVEKKLSWQALAKQYLN